MQYSALSFLVISLASCASGSNDYDFGEKFQRLDGSLAPENNKQHIDRHIRRSAEGEDDLLRFVVRFDVGDEMENDFESSFGEFVVQSFDDYPFKFLDIPSVISEEAIMEIRQKTYVLSVSHEVTFFPKSLYWNKGRISDEDISDAYVGNPEFEGTGHGVHIYILDSGVDDHPEFGTRVERDGGGLGKAFLSRSNTYDCLGHGTRVAGTAAGSKTGLAKDAIIVPYAMLDCDSKSIGNSEIILALTEVEKDIDANRVQKVVINLSLGPGEPMETEDELRLVESRLAGKGAVIIRAAGNNGDDACLYGLDGLPHSLIVGSSTSADKRADHSNYGSCVDIFAPGTNITHPIYEAYADDSRKYGYASGTSFAAPLVSGAAALIMNNRELTGVAVHNEILSKASSNKLSALTGPSITNNKLLQVNQVKLYYHFDDGHKKMYRYMRTNHQAYRASCTWKDSPGSGSVEDCARKANRGGYNTFEFKLYKWSNNCILRDCPLYFNEVLDTDSLARPGGMLVYTDIRAVPIVKGGYTLQPYSYSDRNKVIGCDKGTLYSNRVPSLADCIESGTFTSATAINFELVNNTCVLLSCPSDRVSITTASNTWVSYSHYTIDKINRDGAFGLPEKNNVPWGSALKIKQGSIYWHHSNERDDATTTSDWDQGTFFYLFPQPNRAKQNENCVSWGEKVAISMENTDYFFGDYTWYGHRVAYVSSTKALRFNHGGTSPTVFVIRPPVDEDKTGCIKIGEDFILATTTEIYNHCGNYGCRVTYTATDGDIYLDHGNAFPQKYNFVVDNPVKWATAYKMSIGNTFLYHNSHYNEKTAMTHSSLATPVYLFPRVGVAKQNENCISWGEKVAINKYNIGYKHEGVSWYGYRIAIMDPDTQLLRFHHGGEDPQTFYIRPPAGQTRTGCVQLNEKFVLAKTPEAVNNCGSYGCRVALKDSDGHIKFKHGETDPEEFSFVSPSETDVEDTKKFRFVPALRQRILDEQCDYIATKTRDQPSLCINEAINHNSNAFQWSMNGECQLYDCTQSVYNGGPRDDEVDYLLTYVHESVVPFEYLGFSRHLDTSKTNPKLNCDNFKSAIGLTVEDCAFYTLSINGNAFSYQQEKMRCIPSLCVTEATIDDSSGPDWLMFIDKKRLSFNKPKYVVTFEAGASNSTVDSFKIGLQSQVFDETSITLDGNAYKQLVIDIESLSDLDLMRTSGSIQSIEKSVFNQNMATQIIDFSSNSLVNPISQIKTANKNEGYRPNKGQTGEEMSNQDDYSDDDGDNIVPSSRPLDIVQGWVTENSNRRRRRQVDADESLLFEDENISKHKIVARATSSNGINYDLAVHKGYSFFKSGPAKGHLSCSMSHYYYAVEYTRYKKNSIWDPPLDINHEDYNEWQSIAANSFTSLHDAEQYCGQYDLCKAIYLEKGVYFLRRTTNTVKVTSRNSGIRISYVKNAPLDYDQVIMKCMAETTKTWSAGFNVVRGDFKCFIKNNCNGVPNYSSSTAVYDVFVRDGFSGFSTDSKRGVFDCPVYETHEPEILQNANQGCWTECGTGGPCSHCGTEGQCCRSGFATDPASCNGEGGATSHRCIYPGPIPYRKIVRSCKDRVIATGSSGFTLQANTFTCAIYRCSTDTPVFETNTGSGFDVFVYADDFARQYKYSDSITAKPIRMESYEARTFDRAIKLTNGWSPFGKLNSEWSDIVNGGYTSAKFQENFGYPVLEGRYGYKDKTNHWDFKGITDSDGAYVRKDRSQKHTKADFYTSEPQIVGFGFYDDQGEWGIFDQNGGWGTYDQNGGWGQFDQNGGYGIYDQNGGFGQYDQNGGWGAFDQCGGWGTFDQNGGWGIFDQNGGFGTFDQNGGWGVFDQNGGFGGFDQNGGWGTFDQFGGWDAGEGKQATIANMLPGSINEFDPSVWVFDSSDTSFTLDSFSEEEITYESFIEVHDKVFKFVDYGFQPSMMNCSSDVYNYNIYSLENCISLMGSSNNAFSYSPTLKLCIRYTCEQGVYDTTQDKIYGFLTYVGLEIIPNEGMTYKLSPFGRGITVRCQVKDRDFNTFENVVSLESCLAIGSTHNYPILYYNRLTGVCNTLDCTGTNQYKWHSEPDPDLTVYVKQYVNTENPVHDGSLQPAWSAWTDTWSICTATCDGGLRYQYRTCIKLAASQTCAGLDSKKEACNTEACYAPRPAGCDYCLECATYHQNPGLKCCRYSNSCDASWAQDKCGTSNICGKDNHGTVPV